MLVTVTLGEAKQFLRLEEDFIDDDALIQTLMGAAEGYLQNATGQLFDNTNDLAKLLCFVLIADWYENREMVGKVSERVRHSVQSIVSQLQNAYPTIALASLPDAKLGVQYTASLMGTGGEKPYRWSIVDGTLPDGLTLDARTGVVSGTPTQVGETTVTVQLTDSSPAPKIVKRPMTLVVVE